MPEFRFQGSYDASVALPPDEFITYRRPSERCGLALACTSPMSPDWRRINHRTTTLYRDRGKSVTFSFMPARYIDEYATGAPPPPPSPPSCQTFRTGPCDLAGDRALDRSIRQMPRAGGGPTPPGADGEAFLFRPPRQLFDHQVGATLPSRA